MVKSPPLARYNEFGQPIGAALDGWTERATPPRTTMAGHWCRIEPLSVERHAASLTVEFLKAPDGRDWTYMSAGPFADAAQIRSYLVTIEASDDPLHHAIVDQRSGDAIGTAALMRIDRRNGVIEVGHIAYSRRLRNTAAGTEAIYLFMRRVFDELGYRRFEWKCDDLNAPSRTAALRYGFAREGTFRQAVVYKGRNRDTAWFAMTDGHWASLRAGYAQWLAADNFDADGRQKRRLVEFTASPR